jgi:hypothetical protein
LSGKEIMSIKSELPEAFETLMRELPLATRKKRRKEVKLLSAHFGISKNLLKDRRFIEYDVSWRGQGTVRCGHRRAASYLGINPLSLANYISRHGGSYTREVEGELVTVTRVVDAENK